MAPKGKSAVKQLRSALPDPNAKLYVNLQVQNVLKEILPRIPREALSPLCSLTWQLLSHSHKSNIWNKGCRAFPLSRQHRHREIPQNFFQGLHMTCVCTNTVSVHYLPWHPTFSLCSPSTTPADHWPQVIDKDAVTMGGNFASSYFGLTLDHN